MVATTINTLNSDGSTTTTVVNDDGTTNNLSYYLANDYFAPNTSGYNSAHAVFYGGYDPNLSENFNPSAPDAGSLPDFIQAPGFNFGNTFGGIANFTARPEVDLVNPSPSNGGFNGGNIEVLTNWNFGAGVQNSDGSVTLAYRYQGTIAPVISLRAAGDVQVDASISDGFFQTGAVTLPTGARSFGPPTYAGSLASYEAIIDGIDGPEATASTQIMFVDQSGNPDGELSVSSIDPNYILAMPLPGGSMQYYANYEIYANELYGGDWLFSFNNFNGFFAPVTPPNVGTPVPVAPAQSDPNYASDYQAYLAQYGAWLFGNFSDPDSGEGTPPRRRRRSLPPSIPICQ